MLSYIKKEEDRIKAKANFDHVLLGNAFILEEEYGDVERRYYENNYSPIIKENGAVAGLTLILTDIPERKKLEFERNKLINELQDNLKKVKQLSGMLYPSVVTAKKYVTIMAIGTRSRPISKSIPRLISVMAYVRNVLKNTTQNSLTHNRAID